MRHNLKSVAMVVFLFAAAVVLTGVQALAQQPAGPAAHQPRHLELPGAKLAAKPHVVLPHAIAQPAAAIAKPKEVRGPQKPLWDRLLKSIVDVGIDLLSGNEAELLSNNEAELLSGNRAEVLSGNSPKLLSDNKPELLSRNQTLILSGNRISLRPQIKVEIHISNSGNRPAEADAKK